MYLYIGVDDLLKFQCQIRFEFDSSLNGCWFEFEECNVDLKGEDKKKDEKEKDEKEKDVKEKDVKEKDVKEKDDKEKDLKSNLNNIDFKNPNKELQIGFSDLDSFHRLKSWFNLRVFADFYDVDDEALILKIVWYFFKRITNKIEKIPDRIDRLLNIHFSNLFSKDYDKDVIKKELKKIHLLYIEEISLSVKRFQVQNDKQSTSTKVSQIFPEFFIFNSPKKCVLDEANKSNVSIESNDNTIDKKNINIINSDTIEIKSENMNKKKGYNKFLLDTAFDMGLMIIGFYIYNISKNKEIFFDLPAGAGKSTVVLFLSKLFSSKLLISCPTAMACMQYNVRTIHSTFFINPSKDIYNVGKDMYTFLMNKFKDIDMFIFDEFSMITLNVYYDIKRYFSNKSVFFIGDSAQLLPVKSKLLTNSINNITRFMSSDNFFLPRYEKNSEYDYSDFIKFLRKCVISKPENINQDNIHKIISIFKQNLVIHDIASITKKYNEEHDLAKKEIKSESYQFHSCTPLVVGKNSNHPIINKSLRFDCYNDQKIESSIFINETQSLLVDSIVNFIDRNKKNKFIDQFLAFLTSTSCHLSSIDSKICIGSTVIFKKNYDNVYNGKIGTLVKIEIPDNFVIKRLYQIMNRNICIYRGSLPVLTFKTCNYYYDVNAFQNTISISEEYNQTNLVNFYNTNTLNNKQENKGIFESIDYFENARNIENIENLENKSIKKFKPETKIEKYNFVIEIFYIQPAYCTTLHQLQGSTIKEQITVSDDVLLFNVLRAFYVLVSRVTKPEYMILTKIVLKKFLDRIKQVW